MRLLRPALAAAFLAAAATAATAAPPPAAPSTPPAAVTGGAALPGARALAEASAAVTAVEREGRSFLEEHLPPALLRRGPLGLAWWQWLALPLAAAFSLALGAAAGWATRRVLGHLAGRTETTWDDLLIERLSRPITLFWALVVASALRPALALDGGLHDGLGRFLKAGFFLAAFWGAFRAIDVAFGVLAESPAARANAEVRGLVPLFRKIAKAMALALGLVAVLTELGFQVTSLLAGLGIGGLAVALAAQKTVENLIGSLTIGLDRPFRVGDFVQVDGTQGTVEVVGIRSTRIRTLDRTLVTLPNGKLADMRVESYAARDRFRLNTVLGLTYSTGAAQLRQVMDGVRAALQDHPALGPEAPVVRFADLGDSALRVEVMAWLKAPSFDDFAAMRSELLLRFLAIVEEAGADFAFPTRTVHVASLPPPAPGPGAPPAGRAGGGPER